MRTFFVPLFLLSLGVTAHAAPIVDTDFEPPAVSVGNLNGQYSSGPNPWTSIFGTVTNFGPVQGTQAANYGNIMPRAPIIRTRGST